MSENLTCSLIQIIVDYTSSLNDDKNVPNDVNSNLVILQVYIPKLTRKVLTNVQIAVLMSISSMKRFFILMWQSVERELNKINLTFMNFR